VRSFFLVVLGILWAGSAQAATLNVIGGVLHGATGVDVGGIDYDVEFVDGTCIGLFAGCDDPADFTFTSSASAVLASQALLDQVFLDVVSGSFDSEPSLIAGCGHLNQCQAFTPYAVDPGGWLWASSNNWSLAQENLGFLDFVLWNAGSVMPHWGSDFSIYDFRVYAKWSPVPEPSSALLLGLGLASAAAWRRA